MLQTYRHLLVKVCLVRVSVSHQDLACVQILNWSFPILRTGQNGRCEEDELTATLHVENIMVACSKIQCCIVETVFQFSGICLLIYTSVTRLH